VARRNLTMQSAILSGGVVLMRSHSSPIRHSVTGLVELGAGFVLIRARATINAA